jgi:hypothetical protein
MEVWNEKANGQALETGFIKRVRAFDGAAFAHGVIFDRLQEPDHCQLWGRRDGEMNAPGLFQRLTLESAEAARYVQPSPGTAISPAKQAGRAGPHPLSGFRAQGPLKAARPSPHTRTWRELVRSAWEYAP